MSVAGDVWSYLPSDPFVLSYLARAKKQLGQEYGQPQIRSPHQVIGEQRTFALVLRSQEAQQLRNHPELAGVGSLAEAMLRAVPFLWMNDIDRMAAALPIPEHTIAGDLLQYRTLWWTFEGGHPMKGPSGEVLGLADGFLIDQRGDRVVISVIGQAGDPRVGLDPLKWGLGTSASFRLGSHWPTDIPERDRPTVGRVLACLAFLSAPFVEQYRNTAPRKKGAPSRPPSTQTVRFIKLRSPVRLPADGHPSETTREWTVRWIVRGHLRAQWYPSAEAHRLIWIAPYEKGPEWAPMKMPAYAVIR